jgi:hypothetical protein
MSSQFEKRLQFGALVAALAAIPVVYIQSSKNHELYIFAEILGVAIWLFFLFEVVVLTWLAEDKRQWLLGHKLEVVIVLLSSPVTLLINEGDSVLTVSPLLAIPWLLKISKVSKLVKIGKVVKTGKIIRKSSAISHWLKVIAFNAAVLLIVGIAGMLVGKKAYSPRDGLRNWGEFLSDGVGLPSVLGQFLIVITAVLATTITMTKR